MIGKSKSQIAGQERLIGPTSEPWNVHETQLQSFLQAGAYVVELVKTVESGGTNFTRWAGVNMIRVPSNLGHGVHGIKCGGTKVIAGAGGSWGLPFYFGGDI